MIRHTAFAALLLAGTACSAKQANDFPQAKGMTDEGPNGATGSAAHGGPQGPVVAGSNMPVPKNSPLEPGIRNIAATTGRANLTPTPPPFKVETIGKFDEPFAMAFLPNGDLLVTEKAGQLKLRRPSGQIVDIAGMPAVARGGQGGLLDVAVLPGSADTLYLSYAEPRPNGGSALALATAKLDVLTRAGPPRSISGLKVLWRAGSDGPGGQFGAKIAFAPDGRSLFLTSGERQRFTPAQDPNQLLGKIVHLTLDGKAIADNPFYAQGGYRAEIWSSGHRNPYGLVFAPDGKLWEEEMGPRGGDELNLILPGRNYGWPIVSNGDNYSGQPIPDHPSRPDFEAPKLWWNPSISPSGMILYSGAMFPAYRGNLLIGALSGKALIRVAIDGVTAKPLDQWDMGTRIRDVAQAPDGAIWLLEDGDNARLLRLTPR